MIKRPKMHANWVILLLFVTVLMTLKCYGNREYYTTADPEIRTISQGAAKKIRPRISGRDAIQAVSLTLPTFANTNAGIIEGIIRGRPKKVTLRAATKYKLTNGVEIVGPSYISVHATGKTIAEAEMVATQRARLVLADLATVLKSQGIAVQDVRID